MPKAEWQEVARLIKKHMEPKQQTIAEQDVPILEGPVPKIEVHLSDGSTMQVKVRSVLDATAGEVKEEIFRELNLDKTAEPIFALWLRNSRLSKP